MSARKRDQEAGSGEIAPGRWRSILALLANEHTSRILARLILGEDVSPHLDAYSPSRRAHILASLATAGVIRRTPEGRVEYAPDIFGELLRAGASPRPSGVERFLVDGRISSYPSSLSERRELLSLIASRVLDVGEVVTEKVLNSRLVHYSSDFAVLRRYLVDFELIERSRDGSEYLRVGGL